MIDKGWFGKYNKLHRMVLDLKTAVLYLNYNNDFIDMSTPENGYLSVDEVANIDKETKEVILRICKDIEAEIGNV